MAPMPEPLPAGLSIKEVLKRRNLTQKQLELEVKRSKGYIGKIDQDEGKGDHKGKVKPSRALLTEIANRLGVHKEYFYYLLGSESVQPEDNFTQRVFDCLFETEDFDGQCPPSIISSKKAKPTIIECGDQIALSRAIQNMIATEGDLGKNGEISVLWTARNYAKKGSVYQCVYNQAIPSYISKLGKLTHIWRSNNSHSELTEIIFIILENVKRYSRFKNYECLLSTVPISPQPADVYFAQHSGLVSAYSTTWDLEPTIGVYIPHKVAVASEYMKALKTSAAPVVHHFAADRQEEAYQDYNATAEVIRGPRYIVQRRFADVTRPASHFEEGSLWWERNAQRRRNKVPIDRFAKYRRDASRRFAKRLDLERDPFRQIACLETLERWAQTGHRSDWTLLGGSETARPEKKQERIERIDEIRSLFMRYSHFELAIVEEDNFVSIAGRPTNATTELGWVLNGTSGVIVEVADITRGDGGEIYRVAIEHEVIASQFSSAFEKQWDRLPANVKSREVVLDRLAKLRSLATNS